MNLTNTGLKKVYDVRVDMQLDADITKFPFDINEGNYNRKMGDMESGQMVTVPYSMMVREDVKSGFFPIHYLVTYREEEGGEFSEPVDKVFYVRVKGKMTMSVGGLRASRIEPRRVSSWTASRRSRQRSMPGSRLSCACG